jgi:hypothetical protein
MKYLYFLGAESIGIILLVYSFQIVRIFGHNSWAEEKLGPGGSYTLWKLVGIALIVLSPFLMQAGIFG